MADNLDTSHDKTITVPVTSIRTEEGGSSENWGWTISTVKVGDGSEVAYNDGDKVCGLEFEKSGVNLMVKATHRTSVDPSTHSYWINDNGRTDNLEWTPDPLSRTGITDLSTFNFMTEGAQAMNTANCYIIRRAGTYKLPLVYGNGIVNGAENVQAYAPEMAAGGRADRFLSPFVNHTGAGITSAFIENNTGCTAQSAGIIWQEKAVVVKNLSIEDGAAPHTEGTPYTTSDVRYLQFEVDVDTICQNNAIIAVYDGPDCTGNVIWSWHIWTTNSPALLQNAIPVTNYDGNEYDFFPITNLGWIDWLFFPAEEDVTVKLVQNTTGSALEVTVKQPERSMKSTGCWYQFGRKDPICNRPSTNYFPGKPADGVFNPYGEGPMGIDTAIRTPGTFYKTTSQSSCADKRYNNLWTGKFCEFANEEQNDDMIETIYDPSPVGYKVPASKAFSGFALDGSDATSIDIINKEGDFYYGWNLYTKPGKQGSTILFAASSQRTYDTGKANGAAEYGMYWSANPSIESGMTEHAYYLYIQPTKLTTHSEHARSYGF